MSFARRLARSSGLALCLALGGAAFAEEMHSMPGMSHDGHGGTNAMDKEMMSGMDKMSRDMAAVPMTGDADKDFVAMMIPHHQGAIAMAEIELKYGKDPALLALARDVIAAQDKEIAMMKAWQASHR